MIKPCPQRDPTQATCGDSSCQNCDNNFLDVADLDMQYLSGDLAVQIFTQMPAKSGRRRAILAQEHCQMSVDDLDMDRIQEFSTGTTVKRYFRFLKSFLTFSTNISLARNHVGGPLRIRVHAGTRQEVLDFVEVILLLTVASYFGHY